MIYKVSFVVPGRRDVGGIQNMDREPQPGDRVRIGNQTFEVVEVTELMPPRGDFAYLHATCKPTEA
ncbi:MAG: hypothetical protein P8186_11990 [Anaerolineae bacterium]|jgi:hypothetical protein